MRKGAGRLMVSITLGNALSLVLPGILVILAFGHFDVTVESLLKSPANLTAVESGVLVAMAGLAGGVIDALRRVTLDQLLPRTSESIYGYLTVENLPLFEAGVENSYKYYTFYANLAFAALILLLVRLTTGARGPVDAALVITTLVVGYAAKVQHGWFLAFANGFIEVEKRHQEKGGP